MVYQSPSFSINFDENAARPAWRIWFAVLVHALLNNNRKPTKHMNAIEHANQIMQSAGAKGFNHPDEVREFPKGRLELITIGGATVGRAILEPGWRWSTSIQPIAKTHSCEAAHLQYHVSGVLVVLMDDGTEIQCNPGDVSFLPPGHDAWVVGDKPAVIVDFQGMIDFAKSEEHN